MPFVKLDTGIVTSTLWVDVPCREVFITALLLAEPYELTEVAEQIEVRTLNKTGFQVSPGWYGFVRAAGIGIIGTARIEQEQGMIALEKLGRPDPESRSSEFDGRRLVRVNGGFIVLNYMKYRDHDHSSGVRQRRLRERKKSMSAWPHIPTEQWQAVVAFYSGVCAYCQKSPWEDMEHVVPMSQGGTNDISNVVPSCHSCNAKKKSKTWEVPVPHPFMSRVTVTEKRVTTVTNGSNRILSPVTSHIADADADADADKTLTPANREIRTVEPSKPSVPGFEPTTEHWTEQGTPHDLPPETLAHKVIEVFSLSNMPNVLRAVAAAIRAIAGEKKCGIAEGCDALIEVSTRAQGAGKAINYLWFMNTGWREWEAKQAKAAEPKKRPKSPGEQLREQEAEVARDRAAKRAKNGD